MLGSKFDDFIKFRETNKSESEKPDENFQALLDWTEEYKKKHQDAGDEEFNQARGN